MFTEVAYLLCVLSCVWLYATPWTLCNPCQAPLSMRYSRQEYWSGSPFSSPGNLPNSGIQPTSPSLPSGFFTTSATWEAQSHSVVSNCLWPHGLSSPWNSPGQNTGVGSCSLLQQIFLNQGSNPGLQPRSPTLQVDSLPSEPPENPKNTGVGRLSLLQGIFPTQELNWGLLHCRQILYQLSHRGSPRILEWVAYPFSSRSSRPRSWTRVSWTAGGFLTNWATREWCVVSLGSERSWLSVRQVSLHAVGGLGLRRLSTLTPTCEPPAVSSVSPGWPGPLNPRFAHLALTCHLCLASSRLLQLNLFEPELLNSWSLRPGLCLASPSQ